MAVRAENLNEIYAGFADIFRAWDTGRNSFRALRGNGQEFSRFRVGKRCFFFK